jgi:hypothetical protein
MVYGRKVIIGDRGALAGEGNKGYTQEAQKDKVKAKRVPLWHKPVPKEHGKGEQKDHNSQIHMSHQGMVKVPGREEFIKDWRARQCHQKSQKTTKTQRDNRK